MITLEVNGIRYNGFTDISVFRSVETISGSFTFSATSDNIITFPIKAGQSCKVFIDNISVINGYIESVQVQYSATSHSIAVSGRDKTADIIDSSVIGKKEFKSPITLPQIIDSSIKTNGITDISIINQVSGLASFPEGENFSAEIGETVFEFIEKYARKRQVLLTTDGAGNIVITRAGVAPAITSLQKEINNQQNNILSASISYDYVERFNSYKLESQGNPSATYNGSDIENENVVSQTGSAVDNNIRASRKTQILSNSSDNIKDLQNLATWHANLRRARSIQYTVQVQGFYQDEAKTRLWIPNELVQVKDDFSDIRATMLVKSVEYNFSLQGSITSISLVQKDAYTLEANIVEAEARANDIGDNLTFSG